MPASAIGIPQAPDDITAAWLSRALATPVAGVTRRDIGAGLGNTSIVLGLELNYGAPTDLPAAMVAKLRHPVTAERAKTYGYNLRETAFYRDAAQHLPPRLAPACYFQACDPAGDPFIVLMEQVVGRSPDIIGGCTADDVAVFLEALAALHGSLRGSSRLRDWPWLTGFDQTFSRAIELFPTLVPHFVEQQSGRAADRTLRVMTEVAPLWGRYLAACARRPDAGVAMFDSKVENGIYVPTSAGGERVVLIDFALASRSTGAWDVVNVFTGLPTEIRRKTLDGLLTHYVEALEGTESVGARDRFQLEFEEGLLLQLVFVSLVAATPVSDPRIGAMVAALVQRVLAIADDHDLGPAAARWRAL